MKSFPPPSEYSDWFARRQGVTNRATSRLRHSLWFRHLSKLTRIRRSILEQAFAREYFRLNDMNGAHITQGVQALGRLWIQLAWHLSRSVTHRAQTPVHTQFLFEDWFGGAFDHFGHRWLVERWGVRDYSVVCLVGRGKAHDAAQHAPNTLYCTNQYSHPYATGSVLRCLLWSIVAAPLLLIAQIRMRGPVVEALRILILSFLFYNDVFTRVHSQVFVTGQAGISPVAYGCFKLHGGASFCVIQNGFQSPNDITAYLMGDLLVTWGPHFSRVYKRNHGRFRKILALGSLRLNRYLESWTPQPPSYDICAIGTYFTDDVGYLRPGAAELVMQFISRFSREHTDLRVVFCEHQLSRLHPKTERGYLNSQTPPHRLLFPAEDSYSAMLRSRVVISLCSSMLIEAAARSIPIVICDYSDNPSFWDESAHDPPIPRETDSRYSAFEKALLESLRSAGTPKDYSPWFSTVRLDYPATLYKALMDPLAPAP